MPHCEVDEIVESLRLYHGQIKTIEDAIRIVELYVGTQEDLGHTRHVVIAEALYRRIGSRSQLTKNASAPDASLGELYQTPRHR
jgi:hypothetical protein